MKKRRLASKALASSEPTEAVAQTSGETGEEAPEAPAQASGETGEEAPQQAKKSVKKRRKQASQQPAEQINDSSKSPEEQPEPVLGTDADEKGSEEAVDVPGLVRGAILQQEEAKEDRRGICHVAAIPNSMSHPEFKRIMEKFGEIGRYYMQPEDAKDRLRRKRSGGEKRIRYTEAWVEFAERKLAKRVAESLHGTQIGGHKRRARWHGDIWNIRYLPKFKWTQLREGATYNKVVRRARFEQKLNQATRENNAYLDRVHEHKVRGQIEERRSSKRAAKGDAKEPSENPGQPEKAKQAGSTGAQSPRFPNTKKTNTKPAFVPRKENGVSTGVLRSLFACD